MLRLATDEDFPGSIIRGLLRQQPDLDLVRVVDAGLSGKRDSEILEWAATEGRVLLTRDKATLRDFATDRVSNGQPMAGVFVLRKNTSTRAAIEDILLRAQASAPDEWKDRVEFIPFD